ENPLATCGLQRINLGRIVLGPRTYSRIAVSHRCPVLKIYFSEFKRCEDSTSIKTIRIVDFLKVGDRSSAAPTAEAFTACSHQNRSSLPWLVPGSAARHGDRSPSDPPPGCPDRTGAGGRIPPR